MLKRILLIIQSFLILLYIFIASGMAVAQDDNLVVHFIDVGQGDCTLIQIHNKTMLIDAGDRKHGQAVVSFLKSHNVSQIDVLVATNPCSEHIGGIGAVLDNFTVKQVWDTGLSYDDQTYKNFLAKVNRKNIPYVVAERGQSVSQDPSLSIDVLSPPEQRFGMDVKNNSIVLKLTHGDFSILFMSDAGFAAENNLLAQNEYQLMSHVLKVADHGSRNSSSREFLKAVDPRLSIISVGKNYPYGYPDREALDSTHAVSRVLRTDEEGTFTFTSNGTNDWLHIERPLPCIPPPPPSYTPTPNPSAGPSPFLSVLLTVLVFIIVVIYINHKK